MNVPPDPGHLSDTNNNVVMHHFMQSEFPENGQKRGQTDLTAGQYDADSVISPATTFYFTANAYSDVVAERVRHEEIAI